MTRRPSVRSPEERNTLIVPYLPLVPWVLRKCFGVGDNRIRRIGGYEEAKAWGYLGLVRAGDLWHAEGLANFPTFAIHHIRAALADAVRTADVIRIPRKPYKAGYRMRRVVRSEQQLPPQEERDDPTTLSVWWALERVSPSTRKLLLKRFWERTRLKNLLSDTGKRSDFYRTRRACKEALEEFRTIYLEA